MVVEKRKKKLKKNEMNPRGAPRGGKNPTNLLVGILPKYSPAYRPLVTDSLPAEGHAYDDDDRIDEVDDDRIGEVEDNAVEHVVE